MQDTITIDLLTDEQRSTLDSIVSIGNKLQRLAAVASLRGVRTCELRLSDALPVAAPAWETISSAHGEPVLASLVALGLIERWERPDYPAVTLTPSGAVLLGVVTEEHWEFQTVHVDQRPTRMGYEVPQWQSGEMTREGGVRHRQQKRRLGESNRLTERPIHQPKNIMEQELRNPEQIEDKRSGRKYVSNFYEGGETDDKNKAATLFRSVVDGKGWEAAIDPRLGKKPNARMMAAAKRSASKAFQPTLGDKTERS